MNSEELEVSLRTEVDNHLRSMFAQMRHEIANIQSVINIEFERHRTQIDQALTQLLNRTPDEMQDNNVLNDFITEHLRVAREEGANSVVQSISQDQSDFNEQSSSSAKMRDAISDISNQTSQAEILKALVRHASNFAVRGVLFIVKSEHLIGWRVFDEQRGSSEETVREVFIPLTSESLLSTSIKNLSIKRISSENILPDDAQVLSKLSFEQPNEMVAIPLIVRGRSVAALYADSGVENSMVDVEALESLVRVASLTVEMLASARNSTSSRQPASSRESSATNVPTEERFTPAPSSKHGFEIYTPVAQPQSADNFSGGSYNQSTNASSDKKEISTYEEPSSSFEVNAQPSADSPVDPYQTFTFDTPSTNGPSNGYGNSPATETNINNEYSQTSFDSTSFGDSAYNGFSADNGAAQIDVNSASSSNAASYSQPTPVVEGATAMPAAGEIPFSKRNVELPIDVPEEERRLHNDARRFARLLVSEIKLYNEKKVKEGREYGDLYDRLRDAVDRSREMYDKRVSPVVAAKFDYFHYELINILAEGDETKLGSSYASH